MAQPRPNHANIVVRNGDIRKYFDDMEWRELSAYEKEQTRNVLRNYLVMTSIGFKAPLPFFISEFEARKDQASIAHQNSSSASTKIKRCPPKHEEATTKARGRSPKNKEATTEARGCPPKNKEAKKICPTRQQPPRRSKTKGRILIKNSMRKRK